MGASNHTEDRNEQELGGVRDASSEEGPSVDEALRVLWENRFRCPVPHFAAPKHRPPCPACDNEEAMKAAYCRVELALSEAREQRTKDFHWIREAVWRFWPNDIRSEEFIEDFEDARVLLGVGAEPLEQQENEGGCEAASSGGEQPGDFTPEEIGVPQPDDVLDDGTPIPRDAGLDWEDVCGYYQVAASIAQGDGYWPSMVNVDATELSGSITSDCARRLAAMLVRAADACDASMTSTTDDLGSSPDSDSAVLRFRVAELERERTGLIIESENAVTGRESAEARVAELEAALRETRELIAEARVGASSIVLAEKLIDRVLAGGLLDTPQEAQQAETGDE